MNADSSAGDNVDECTDGDVTDCHDSADCTDTGTVKL